MSVAANFMEKTSWLDDYMVARNARVRGTLTGTNFMEFAAYERTMDRFCFGKMIAAGLAAGTLGFILGALIF